MAVPGCTAPTIRPRLLVVDDEAPVRSSLARVLSLRGYRVCQAASGREALRLLGSTPCDAMVLDINMPDANGIEVMRDLRENSPERPSIVILTGRATLESAIEAVKAGAADYLIKPASIYAVITAVDEALEERGWKVCPSPSPLGSAKTSAGQPHTAASTPDFALRTRRLRLSKKQNVVSVSQESEQGDRRIKLTRAEAELLGYLIGRAGAVVSCREMAKDALGYDVSEREAQRIIRPHIYRLRRKIESDPTRPLLIRSVLRRGYLLAK